MALPEPPVQRNLHTMPVPPESALLDGEEEHGDALDLDEGDVRQLNGRRLDLPQHPTDCHHEGPEGVLDLARPRPLRSFASSSRSSNCSSGAFVAGPLPRLSDSRHW